MRTDRYRLLTALLALAAGLAVFALAGELFPYHSSNHDEGVYLQSAAMLLEGKLWLAPGSEPLHEAVHPWFFVEGERGLYPKYAPVPAAVFALGKLAGGYRLSLFAVAAANVALGSALAAEAFDRRTGLLAAAVMAGAPLFLLSSSVFLPYAPTTALNLAFALAYVRSVRREDRRYAALAGIAIGLSFFARPYTAVLFAAPFLAYALVRLSRAAPDDPGVVLRHGLTAAFGLSFVAVALAYNALLTGSALLFPYEAFAPLDGLGFGRRRLLGYSVAYTPELALRANAAVLWAFATDWFTAGPLGTAAAVVGIAAVAAGIRRDGLRPVSSPDDSLHAVPSPSDRVLQILLLSVIVSVVAGNVYFWGNLNILGDLVEPGDGFIGLFGPFYHFDLLLPLSAFAAHGALASAGWLRDRARDALSPRGVKIAALLLLAVALPVVGAAETDALGPPVERNAAYTEKYERAYAPFEEREMTNALVFLPPAYGEWRNHPFQWLRNDPGFDGPVVYATARNPEDDFAVMDAYPNRAYYRYRYHGEWTPDPNEHVSPVLERLELREGAVIRARTEVAVPQRITSASVAVSNGETVRRYDVGGELPETLAVNWTLSPEGVTVSGPNLTTRYGDDAGPVPIEGVGEIALSITISEPGGGTLTYREEALVRVIDGRVQAVWPPASSVCLLVTDCGRSGTYLPDRPETRPDGIQMNTTGKSG